MATLIERIWPPIEAARANAQIEERRSEQNAEKIWAVVDESASVALSSLPDDTKTRDIVSNLVIRESQRRDVLDNKASTIIQAGGIVSSIVALAPALLDKSWVIPREWSLAVLAAYLASIIHLIIAVYYAIKARRIVAFAMITPRTFLGVIKKSPRDFSTRLLAHDLADATWNEDIIIMKSNFVAVAEDMLLRGMAFFATSAVLALLWFAGGYLFRNSL